MREGREGREGLNVKGKTGLTRCFWIGVKGVKGKSPRVRTHARARAHARPHTRARLCPSRLQHPSRNRKIKKLQCERQWEKGFTPFTWRCLSGSRP